MSNISGKSQLIGLIANPVAQAASPALGNAWLTQHQLQQHYVLVPMAVDIEHLTDYINGLRHLQNFSGAIVSMPFKTAMVPLVDELSPKAEAIGAVNVIRRNPNGTLSGDILDGEGFVSGLLKAGHQVSGKHCLLAGAGGAASAVALALLQHGCASLGIVNRSRAKAQQLQQRLQQLVPQADIYCIEANNDASSSIRHQLIVNGTSLGMQSDDALPFNSQQLQHAEVVAECVLAPEQTQLLQLAQQLGIKTHTGMPMLQSQIELMLRYMQVS